MMEWVFVLLLTLPSLCTTTRCTDARGAVRAEITAVDEPQCLRLRKLLVQQFGGEQNVKGTVTPCANRTPT